MKRNGEDLISLDYGGAVCVARLKVHGNGKGSGNRYCLFASDLIYTGNNGVVEYGLRPL